MKNLRFTDRTPGILLFFSRISRTGTFSQQHCPHSRHIESQAAASSLIMSEISRLEVPGLFPSAPVVKERFNLERNKIIGCEVLVD